MYVRIHDPVRPADGLPLCDELRRAFDDLGEQSCIFVRHIDKMRVVLRDDIIGEDFELIVLLSIVEDLERTEPHMRRRHPQQHGAGFDLLTIDLVVAAHDAKPPRRRNAEAMHRSAQSSMRADLREMQTSSPPARSRFRPAIQGHPPARQSRQQDYERAATSPPFPSVPPVMRTFRPPKRSCLMSGPHSIEPPTTASCG